MTMRIKIDSANIDVLLLYRALKLSEIERENLVFIGRKGR